MISTAKPRLSIRQRLRLAELADVIFPATEAMPAASTVRLSTRLVERVLRADPRLHGPFARALAALPADEVDPALRALRDADPASFRALILVIVPAYYMATEVRSAIGYDGQQAVRIDTFELPDYLENGALDRVIARHPFYRDVATTGGLA